MKKLLFGLLLLGCGPAPHTRAAGGVGDLAIHPVAWNAAATPVGHVRAVADAGDVVCVFADDGATVFSSGAFVAKDTHVKDWRYGASIFATGGTTRWVIGVDGAGKIHRLRALSTFEDVSARYQLDKKHVREASIIGPGRVAFLLDGELALSDANKTSVYAASTFQDFAGGGGFAAGVTKTGVDLVNMANGLVTRFDLPHARYAALDTRGRLYVATTRAVYAADAHGALGLLYDADHEGIHGLVASGDRIWFADREELGAIDGAQVALSKGAKLSKDAKLEPSPSGDVWAFDATHLTRFSTNAATRTASSWSAEVAPAFARACAQCHRPDGIAGIDLSTESAWTSKRAEIRTRVITEHTMPPEGHQISDADRDSIHHWLEEK